MASENLIKKKKNTQEVSTLLRSSKEKKKKTDSMNMLIENVPKLIHAHFLPLLNCCPMCWNMIQPYILWHNIYKYDFLISLCWTTEKRVTERDLNKKKKRGMNGWLKVRINQSINQSIPCVKQTTCSHFCTFWGTETENNPKSLRVSCLLHLMDVFWSHVPMNALVLKNSACLRKSRM